MAASNPDTRTTENHAGTGRSLSRYDVLLLVIPAVFLIALIGAQISSLSLTPLMAAASGICALLLADGLFVNPPE